MPTVITQRKFYALVVQEYADDLRNFLKPFIERIEVDESEAKMYYTIPMPPHSTSEETVGVLPFFTPRLKERGTQGVR